MFGFGSKKVAEGINWRKAERELAQHREFFGYDVETQKVLRSVNKRPDIFAVKKKDRKIRKVGDAKCVKILLKTHVDQVVGYKGYPVFAKEGVVGIAQDTVVTSDIREYAKIRKVKIVRLRVKREQNFVEQYFLDD